MLICREEPRDYAAVEEFDRAFPPKIKEKRLGQLE